MYTYIHIHTARTLQVISARASHFLNAETCEFPSLSMVPVGHFLKGTFLSHFYELIL